MITEIPTAEDFLQSSLSLLNLGWEIATKSLEHFANSELIHPLDTPIQEVWLQSGESVTIGGPDNTFSLEERAEFAKEFWRRSQPFLGNAHSLVQQSVEFGIKANIAAVSPYLLIMREARENFKASARDIPFSELRGLDAADLLRVHNTVCAQPLDEEFERLWNDIRRQRNIFMHTAVPSALAFRPEEILKNVVVVSQVLHPGVSWFERRLRYANTDEIGAAFDVGEDLSYAQVLTEFKTAFEMLDGSFLKKYFKFDTKSRSYICIYCMENCDDEVWCEGEVGRHAQLERKDSSCEVLWCPLCQERTTIVRQCCPENSCRSNVLSAGADHHLMCLLCGNGPNED